MFTTTTNQAQVPFISPCILTQSLQITPSNQKTTLPPKPQMSRRVTSLSELLQTGPSNVRIFEGLGEIVPPNVLQRFEISTMTMPQPPLQPQPQPPAPIQVVQHPVQLTTGSSQKGVQGRRFTKEQQEAMQAFYAAYPHANKKQRRELGKIIGLDDSQIYFWYQRQKNKQDTSSNEHVVIDLIKQIEELTD